MFRKAETGVRRSAATVLATGTSVACCASRQNSLKSGTSMRNTGYRKQVTGNRQPAGIRLVAEDFQLTNLLKLPNDRIVRWSLVHRPTSEWSGTNGRSSIDSKGIS